MALMTPQEYIESLRKLKTRVYMFGEEIKNWVDHPMIRPSINCVAMTYCKETGALASVNCPSTAIGYYKPSFLPSTCSKHLGGDEVGMELDDDEEYSGDDEDDDRTVTVRPRKNRDDD